MLLGEGFNIRLVELLFLQLEDEEEERDEEDDDEEDEAEEEERIRRQRMYFPIRWSTSSLTFTCSETSE